MLNSTVLQLVAGLNLPLIDSKFRINQQPQKVFSLCRYADNIRANASCQQEPLSVNKVHNNRINGRLLTKF
ncbi:hypothetical protein LC605_15780 [Nostoc sp. CHAB 5836]|uniref:hypothetical protein n=1 Tax=Nostoc sp. CHAB 5836 TaxID=2780404 RepID=UPI001E3FE613|nr:hypothetical protein [Nostoc sp. CHAB 5836]MCC5616505.1 hypothetical protein [Nostoc sp. CHAB 5836]